MTDRTVRARSRGRDAETLEKSPSCSLGAGACCVRRDVEGACDAPKPRGWEPSSTRITVDGQDTRAR
jgi:hypothetical protein